MKLRNVLLTGLFASMALVFNMAEGFLPMPMPGIKLGAANVFALAALVLMGVKEAFAVTLIRVFLAWLISGNAFALACSAAGALPAVLVMSVFYSRYSRYFSLPWVSVAGAWAFNFGQIAVAAALIGDARVLWYIIPLLIAGTVTGWAVGLLAELLCRKIRKNGIDKVNM